MGTSPLSQPTEHGVQLPISILGQYVGTIDSALAHMADESILPRLWSVDHTVWQPHPTEITNRLGWLHIAEAMKGHLGEIRALVDAVRGQGYTHALLLGMGGSSLAPEVLRKTFGVKEDYLDLAVLDSTDPAAVLAHARRLDPARTLFLVSTKSGGTVETFSFFKFFYNWVAEALGADHAGEHFIAITDPGSGLADTAQRYRFRHTFLNDPNIGGRYSALSFFGLVPAGLIGLDLDLLLDRAIAMAQACGPTMPPRINPAAWVGAIMGALAKAGRDKATFVLSSPVASFGDWVEQLIAESTGKEGKGILPVVGEPLGSPAVYGDDRVFFFLEMEGDLTYEPAIKSLADAGHPVVCLRLRDLYDLGGQFFLWEMATAVAGHFLGINPFDQPNVEAAKVLARRMVSEYQQTGKLPELKPSLQAEGVCVYGDVSATSPSEALSAFVRQGTKGDYIAFHAYVPPTPATDAALKALRTAYRDRTRLATTVGYGPRFLHSTGQLHKGDAGRGLFVQFTADHPEDAPIPDEAGQPESSITFGVLIDAQALGDRQALLDNGRRVIRFHLGGDVVTALKRLAGED